MKQKNAMFHHHDVCVCVPCRRARFRGKKGGTPMPQVIKGLGGDKSPSTDATQARG